MHGRKKLAGLAALIVLLAIGPGFGDELSADGPHAFELPLAGINSADLAKFNYGRGLFHFRFSSISHADESRSGLGPYFNADSCGACHVRDGRGPAPKDPVGIGFVLKIGVPGTGPDEVLPHPVFGRQIQTQSIEGRAEGGLAVTYTESIEGMSDGDVVYLRRLEFGIVPADGVGAGPEAIYGPRVAAPVIGMGLLAAVPDSAILALEDPKDLDGDGISGRANWVNGEGGAVALGRFGWKAAAPALVVQAQRAAQFDMGLSVPLFDRPAGDCTDVQTACLELMGQSKSGELALELAAGDIAAIVNYLDLLGFPAPRDAEVQDVAVGRELFDSIGCSACHVAELRTGGSAAFDVLNGRAVPAYTDLLLHDMGPGLADGFGEGQASGSEWRTAPLWGIGLTGLVNYPPHYLHDGRARTLSEAVMWHGGEAQRSRDIFKSLSKASRDRILRFLDGL